MRKQTATEQREGRPTKNEMRNGRDIATYQNRTSTTLHLIQRLLIHLTKKNSVAVWLMLLVHLFTQIMFLARLLTSYQSSCCLLSLLGASWSRTADKILLLSSYFFSCSSYYFFCLSSLPLVSSYALLPANNHQASWYTTAETLCRGVGTCAWFLFVLSPCLLSKPEP